MMIAALIIGGLVVTGLVFTAFAVAFAPVGYQDETGFHFGPKETVRANEDFAFAMAERKIA